MENFKNKVAVITGAASGIGLAIAKKLCKEGARLILADIEAAALEEALEQTIVQGGEAIAVITDVSKEEDIRTLARRTQERYGEVHLLFNNAGVGAGSLIWNSTREDWEWTLGVNLWGLINAANVFIPIMLKQQNQCHIVNTASQAGLVSGPGNGIYRVTKHAIVSFSETLYHELEIVRAKIGVSVLCPGFVNTRIYEAERNRPESLKNHEDRFAGNDLRRAMDEIIRKGVKNGLPSEEVADMVLKAIREEKFYIITDDETSDQVKTRAENIANGLKPSYVHP